MAIKKRIKFEPKPVITGDLAGARHLSWTYLAINNSPFTPIYRPIDVRMMWLDPFLTQWEGAHSRQLINSLDSRHQWLEILMKGPATPAEISPSNLSTEVSSTTPTEVSSTTSTEVVPSPAADATPRSIFFTWVTPHSLTWVPLPPVAAPAEVAPSPAADATPRSIFFTWVTPHSLTWVPLPPVAPSNQTLAAAPVNNTPVNK